MKAKSLNRVRPSATPWTATYQASPSMGFSRQEYWSGVPCLTNCRVAQKVVGWWQKSNPSNWLFLAKRPALEPCLIAFSLSCHAHSLILQVFFLISTTCKVFPCHHLARCLPDHNHVPFRKRKVQCDGVGPLVPDFILQCSGSAWGWQDLMGRNTNHQINAQRQRRRQI